MLAALTIAAAAQVTLAEADTTIRATTSHRCAHATAGPSESSPRAMRRAVRCLVNAERAARGRSRLRFNGRLTRAARRHTRDMVRRRYFDHRRPGGPSLVERVRRAGYAPGTRRWAVAENLGWGSGTYATPASIVQSWMQSRAHRRTLLGNYRQIGVGVARGTPLPGFHRRVPAIVVTADFGRRF